jgi:uncharacterized repeat protein (TIGR01451 family)
VKDQNGNVMPNVTVSFAVTGGGGSVTPLTATTLADGTAQVGSWRLGTTPGQNTMTAAAGNLAPVSFAVTGQLVPATMTAVSPTAMSVTTGTSVPQPPAVVVRDQFGAPLPAVSVQFGITPGGGMLSASNVWTLGDGIARLGSWTLGTTPGTYKVTATLGALAPVEFVATALGVTVSTPLVTIAYPELSVKIAQTASTIIGGTRQTYTVRVNNRGAGGAGSIVLRHALPVDLTYVSTTSDHGFVCTRSGTTVNCVSGTIASGDSATVRIVMALASTAQSGHPIVYGATVDPANAIAESNEANNQAAAVATTQAAVALTDYRVTTVTQLVEMFNLAEANGFEFKSFSSDKDALGNPVKCWIQHGSVIGLAAEAGLPLPGFPLTCVYEWFGRTRKLATGWQLRSVEFGSTLAIFISVGFVEPPNPSSGTAFFSRRLTWADALPMSHAYQDLVAVTLRGPVGADWRDAFR